MSKEIIVISNDGILVKVPQDIKKAFISNWSDNATTLEFRSETYEMEYDSYEYNAKEQLKEITLPVQGEYQIKQSVPQRHKHLIDGDKWFWLKLLTKSK